MTNIPGIHHVTAISGAPQANFDFFAGVLGQKLIKKTVNFDDPGTYHLYYGDATGSPGTILTFFPYLHAAPGRAGPGMASAYAYAVPSDRFQAVAAELSKVLPIDPVPTDRFGEPVLTLRDPDGGIVELIGSDEAKDQHGFHSVTLWERDPQPTLRLLADVFGYVYQGQNTEDGFDRHRLMAPGAARGRIIDVVRSHVPSAARPGAGTIHHIAFRAETPEIQEDWMARLAKVGHRTTPVIDRNYFNAIYFREPGGVLFEIATDPPGFAIDEAADKLGQRLMLPPQYEKMRDQIERNLPPLKVVA